MMQQPSAVELIEAVRDFIDKEVLPSLDGRIAFHGRVAVNALSIVARELEATISHPDPDRTALRELFGTIGSDRELSRELCRRIRSGLIGIDDDKLKSFLIGDTLAKVAVDQPTYSGFLHSPFRTAE